MESTSDIDHQAAPGSSVDEQPVAGGPVETRSLLFVTGVFQSRRADGSGMSLPHRHIEIVREAIEQSERIQEIGRYEDSFLIAFPNPVDAVRFSLKLQASARALGEETHQSVYEQASIHQVTVSAPEEPGAPVAKLECEDHAPLCRWLAGLTKGNQIILTRPAFEEARKSLTKEELKAFGPLTWLAHGPCRVPDSEETLEICELREGGDGSATPPAGLEKAPVAGTDAENTAWGWRPGPGAAVPKTRYVLDGKLGDGRYGEDWSGGEANVKEKKMFQFCFRSDWARSLKEKEAVIDSVKKKLGDNRNVLALQSVSFNEPPFYIVAELFEGKDLVSWAQGFGGARGIPFNARLEIIAQAATGLQGTHEARLLHGDLRPEHILVFGSGATPKDVQVKLANIGVGHIGRNPDRPADDEPSDARTAATNASAPISLETLYKAPEVLAGQAPNAKAELYSMGVILGQMILGKLSEEITPDRIKEVLVGLKRDGLLGFFVADPAARTEGAGRLAGELRAVIKERENRTGPAPVTRRQVLQRVVGAVLFVASIAVLAIYGPKYLRRRQEAAKVPPKPAAKPGEKPKAKDDSDSADGSLLGSESREAATGTDETEETADLRKAKGRSAGQVAIDKKKKDEIKDSVEGLFKFILLPVAVVVIVGSVVPLVQSYLRKAALRK